MTKKLKIFSALAVVAFLAATLSMFPAFTQGTRFNPFISQYGDLTDAISQKLDPPTLPRVVEAKAILAERKSGLQRELATLRALPDSQISTEDLEKFKKSVESNRAKITGILVKHFDVMKKDPLLWEEAKKLVDDYNSLVQ